MSDVLHDSHKGSQRAAVKFKKSIHFIYRKEKNAEKAKESVEK